MDPLIICKALEVEGVRGPRGSRVHLWDPMEDPIGLSGWFDESSDDS